LLLTDLGFEPEPFQQELLRSKAERILLLTHRQAGKSTAKAALGIGTALRDPGSLILVISRSQNQADELFRKLSHFYRVLGEPVPTVEDNAHTLALENSSRIVSLPHSPATIVGYSGPSLIIIDEAARVNDETYLSMSPMLLRSRGKLVAMSTPYGRRGWFYEAWHDEASSWHRIAFKASENRRLDRDYLAEERRRLGERWYLQDFENVFTDTTSQVFSSESIEAALDDDVRPLFPE
jgi:hypothetical protein